MANLTLTNNQLKLIQNALDFYARVGMGQLSVIKEHPTFENVLSNKLRSQQPLKVGDKTERGEVVEIGKPKKKGDRPPYIKTKGVWNTNEEIRTWTDVDQVKHSIDYSRFHPIREQADKLFNKGKNLLLKSNFNHHSSYGIFSLEVDESSRVAYDILQVIRHEFWKAYPNRSEATVDSRVWLRTQDGEKIACTLDGSSTKKIEEKATKLEEMLALQVKLVTKLELEVADLKNRLAYKKPSKPEKPSKPS